MTAFILGVPLPVNTTSMPASGSTASNRPGHLPSRSRMRNRARHPASSRVDPTISPARVLPDHPPAPELGWTARRQPAGPFRFRPGGVPPSQQIPVPAQHRVRTHQQPHRPSALGPMRCGNAASSTRSAQANRTLLPLSSRSSQIRHAPPRPCASALRRRSSRRTTPDPRPPRPAARGPPGWRRTRAACRPIPWPCRR
jgi:hypothetical protein